MRGGGEEFAVKIGVELGIDAGRTRWSRFDFGEVEGSF